MSTMGTTTTETRYLWCGEHLCQARDASHTVIRRYYPEGELRPTDSTTPRRYYGRDHLGSIRDVLALPGGKNIGTADYTPYGKPTKTTGKAKTDFRYAGMFYLPEAGLYLTHYRVYDPTLGRWLSRDPIGEKGGVNLYTYVGNDPINWSDPSGQCPWCIAIWGVIEVGLAIYDWYDTGSTLLDPCASTQDKLLGGSLFLVGAIAPGGGYTALNDLSLASAKATKVTGPIVGGGAKLENLTAQEIARIQNAANRTGTEISVVGSRANGTVQAMSDWDYVVPEPTKGRTIHSLRSSLPEGPRGLGELRNQDFFRATVDPNKPFITFIPQ